MKKKEEKEPLLKQIFGDSRIVALVGEKNSGKTNNLAYLISDFRKHNKKTPIYVFGLPAVVTDELIKTYGVIELSTLKQMKKKENCLIIVDEFQKLKLGDRRNKDDLDNFVDLIYHKNAYAIFSSPNIREFNSVIGSKIERWMIKTVYADDCIQGSQLKKTVNEYEGRFKSGDAIIVPKNLVLIKSDDCEQVIDCEYMEIADNKKDLKSIF